MKPIKGWKKDQGNRTMECPDCHKIMQEREIRDREKHRGHFTQSGFGHWVEDPDKPIRCKACDRIRDHQRVMDDNFTDPDVGGHGGRLGYGSRYDSTRGQQR